MRSADYEHCGFLSEQQFAYSVSKGRHITNYALHSIALLKTNRAVFIISHNISLVRQREADEWLDSSWKRFCWIISKAFIICAAKLQAVSQR